MDLDPLIPPPEPGFLTGSQRGDRILGITLGFTWWALGIVLAAMSSVFVPLTLVAYLVQIIVLGLKPGRGVLIKALVLTTILIPVAVALGTFGMCTLGGLRLGLI